MSETKFTKGEWIVYGDWAIKRKGTTELLASFEERGFNNQEGFANARLIAAAPEMYQALEICLKALPIANESELQDKARIAAFYALAKARGQ